MILLYLLAGFAVREDNHQQKLHCTHTLDSAQLLAVNIFIHLLVYSRTCGMVQTTNKQLAGK